MKRVVFGAFAALLIVFSVFYSVKLFSIIWLLVFLIALNEALDLCSLKAVEKILCLITGLSLYHFDLLNEMSCDFSIFILISVLIAVIVSLNQDDIAKSLTRISQGVFLSIFLSLLRYGVLLCEQISPGRFIFLLSFIWCYDSFAYYGGCRFGKNKISPRISPKKSYEGFISGVVGASAVGALVGGILFNVSLLLIPVYAFGAGLLGHTGDIFESAWKRKADRKDSSSLIPGHGGVWDRVDGAVLVLPAFYVLLKYLPLF